MDSGYVFLKVTTIFSDVNHEGVKQGSGIFLGLVFLFVCLFCLFSRCGNRSSINRDEEVGSRSNIPQRYQELLRCFLEH